MLLLFRVMTLTPALLTAAPGWTVTVRPSWAPALKPAGDASLQMTRVPLRTQSANAGVALPMQKTTQARGELRLGAGVSETGRLAKAFNSPVQLIHLLRRKSEAQAGLSIRT
jgi:hypothetical protein